VAAKKYAKALLEAIKKEDLLGSLKDEMRDIKDIVKEKRTCDYLANRSISRKEKIDAFLGCHPLTKGFLNVVMDYKQEKELYNISREYINLLNQETGEVDVDVSSGITLTEEEKKKLELKLHEHLNKKVNTTYRVDPDLIGGLTIKYGSNVVDASIKGALRNMLKSMTGEPYEE